MKKLNEHRDQIDKIDAEILNLLNQRMGCVTHIGDIKDKENNVYYVPSREAKVYEKLVKANKGPLKKDALKAIFREIMSAALAIEKPLQIAFLGPEGTFTHQASLNKFGVSVGYVPTLTIRDVFDEVVRERCDYGVVPIENTTGGAVTHTLDMFMDYDLKICSEITLGIRHNLIAKNEKVKIEKIYSHAQGFSQCRSWIQMNYPKAQLIDIESTSAAVKHAKTEKNSAAIGSELAATLYELEVISSEIEDSPHNRTRFLIVGTEFSEPTGNDKTSILFSLKDKPGILYDSLKPFKEYDINLSKIESRPAKKKAWEYCFFVDLNGHFKDENVKKALKEIEENCMSLKILGSYPREL